MAFFPAAQQQAGTTRLLLRESDGSVVRRTVLPTGLRVLSESVPGARSATLGVWAGAGSRDETDRGRGAAHFLEHLLFKGTKRRTALDIAAEIDAVGGIANAFTSKEYTCFYAKVLGRDLPVAVDVILDITTRATLRAADIDAERTVVIEEIGMHSDDPGDRASEAVESALLEGSALARPILGTTESITGMTPQAIRSFFRRHYRPEALAVAASGDVDHNRLVALVRAATEDLGWPWGVAPLPLHRGAGSRKPRGRVGLTAQTWSGEQCTVALGVPGLPRPHPDRRTLDVLNEIVGGGMSSRLFQTVREQHGLAYSVYSGHTPYSDAGVWMAAAACRPDRAVQVLRLVREQIGAVVADGVTDEEVDRAKSHLSGSLVLSGEDTSARMVALGRAEVATGELITIDQALERIADVTPDGVRRVAANVLSAPPAVCVVGGPTQAAARRELAAAVEGA
jgi:predicted Zn-dependent peptidase